MKVDYAVLLTRVKTIEKTLNELETDTITKKLLDLQLDSIKQELNNVTDLSYMEIDARIDLLEQQIDFIKDVKGTAG